MEAFGCSANAIRWTSIFLAQPCRRGKDKLVFQRV
jgi:hypothetical protein